MINVNQITSELAKMPDQALQQYAAMHKNDPYMVTLALSESNRRKQMRMGAQGAGAMPQPKVVDQDIAQMAPPPQQQALPEDSGIAQLPAQNMQNMAGGGIVAFDDGGAVPGYAGGVFTGEDPKQKFAQKYHDAAVYAGKQLGVDPGIIISQWGLETGWGRSIIPGTNNLGNIKDFSGKGVPAYDKVEKSTSKYRAYDSPEAFAEDYVKLIKNKYPDSVGVGGDAKKFVTGLRPGEPGGYATDKSYASKFLDTVSAPTAQAATEVKTQAAPTPARAPSVIDQIPGQSGKAPAAKDESTFFGNLADRLGIPQDVQRNISNTLMAPTPLAPVTTLPKAAGSTGIAALGEKLYNAVVPAAGMSEKQIAALRAETEAARAAEAARAGQLPLRVTGPAPAIEQGSQVIPVTQAGQATVQSAADLEKARLANQAADQLAASQAAARAAQETAGLPSAAERLQQASYLRESDEAARLMARARAATNAKTTAQTAEGIAALPDGTEPPYVANTTANAYDTGVMGGAPLPTAEEGIVAALKEKPAEAIVEPEAKKDSTDWNDLMIKMGLNLMASKDPNAISGTGQAGLGTLAMMQAEEKAKSEREAKMSEADYRKAMGEQARAMAAAIERGAKEKNLQLEAEKLIAQEISKDKFINMPGQEAARAARENAMRATIYRQLGIAPTMAAGAPTGGAKFLGFENPT